MNSKLLYAATVAVALISTLALADEAATVSRAQVGPGSHAAIADGRLQRAGNDGPAPVSAVSMPMSLQRFAQRVKAGQAADHG